MKRLVVGAILWLGTSSLFAQGLVNFSHIAGPNGMEASFGFTSHEFDIEGDNARGDAEVEKKILGLGLSYGLEHNLNLYVYGGFSFSSEVEGAPGDDQGFGLGGGVKYQAYVHPKFDLNIFSELSYASDEYGSGVEGTMFDFKLGAVAAMNFSPRFGGYFGVNLIPFSDGEVEFAGVSGDVERDDVFGLLLGVNLGLSRVNIRPEVGFGNESRFSIMVDMMM